MKQKSNSPWKFHGAIWRLMMIFIFSIFLSCDKKEDKIPAGIIPEDKMILIMTDVHLAEAHSKFNMNTDDINKVKQGYYQFIFKKYEITAAQLMNSWEFYASHPEIFSRMYDEVITELSKKQAAMTSKTK